MTQAGVLAAGYVARTSPVHRLAPQAKLVAVVAFALVVVATPVQAPWAAAAYAGYLLVVLTAAAVAGVRPGRLLRALWIEVPFVLFAALLPFLAGGPRVEVLGVPVSASGLAAGGGLLAKATLSVLAATVLAATTQARELLTGLQRLRLPAMLVQILTFMVRYADVVVGELRRMRVARESRGFTGRGPGALRVVGATAGALFVRSYERGERVHLAMLSRGYAGTLPTGGERPGRAADWLTALALPAAAAVVLGVGLLVG